VTLAEPDLYYTGATLIIDHGHRLSSTLMHLDQLDVRVGQQVRQGRYRRHGGQERPGDRAASGLANELARRTD